MSRWSGSAQSAWWRERADPEAVAEGAEVLLATLRRTEDDQGLSRALGNTHFLSWLAHLRWVRMLPEKPAEHAYFGVAENWRAFRSLSAIDDFPRDVTSALSARDLGSKVLENLCEIEKADPAALRRFPGLAIAFAVVWDQPFPESWPHANVDFNDVPIGDPSVAQRFAFFIKSHAAKYLKNDPNSLSIRELTFVVDTPVELRELGYVQQVKLASISKLEQLYRAVPYDNARIAGQNYLWQHGAYRLIDIGKKGGICMDQAYFVAHAGKAQCIPTVLFTGQGRSGDHAWVGFLTGRGRWTLDAARWRGENYPIGLAFDPQSWRRITDQQMEFLVKGEGDSPSAKRGKQILGWAVLNSESPSYPMILKAAGRAMPRSFEPWELEAEWLASTKASPKARRDFWQRWIANFTGERDMKAKGQRALLRVLREMGEDNDAERLERQIITENRSKRFDLGIAVAADAVFALQEAGNWDAAAKEYDRVMGRFKRDAGGHLFYNLVEPYVQACLREGRNDVARAGMDIAEGVLKPQPGSILANDMAGLRAETK